MYDSVCYMTCSFPGIIGWEPKTGSNLQGQIQANTTCFKEYFLGQQEVNW